MKIAVLDDYANISLEMADWSSISDAEISVFNDTVVDRATLVQRLMPFDVVCMMRERTPFPADLLDALPNLQLLVTSGPRNLSIDLDAAKRNGVVVSSTESRKTSTSEFAMLLILALSRGLIPEVNSMQSSGWQSGLGRDLHGLDLGLIGLGKIGAQMAALGKAFGMQVHAWSPNLDESRCHELEVSHATSLAELMGRSDVVSVHMVLSQRTTNLVDADAFAAMRERSVFINTSRGPIANTEALVAGLEAGRPWMAGLDVYDEEPLPAEHLLRNKGLVDSGRLLLSPHLGYVTEQTWKVFYEQTVEAVVAWQLGSPIRQLA